MFSSKCYPSEAGLEVLGNIGRTVSLPCNTTSSPERTVALVMWFKGDSEDPFYSLDLRNVREMAAAKHWAHNNWAERVKFHFEEVREFSKPRNMLDVSCLVKYFRH